MCETEALGVDAQGLTHAPGRWLQCSQVDRVDTMRTVAQTRLDLLRALPGIQPLPLGLYVYFLWRGDALVYIGSTKNLCMRLGEHKRTKVYDRATYYEYASVTDMLAAEQLFIMRHRPPLNKHNVRQSKYEHWTMPTPIANS